VSSGDAEAPLVSRTGRLEKEADMKRSSTLIALAALAAVLGSVDAAAAAYRPGSVQLDAAAYRPGVADPSLLVPLPLIRF
jgi:hypothetical protein